MESTKLTKAEKRELRKQEWQQKAANEAKTAQYKKYGIWSVVVVIIILSIFGLAFIVNSPSSSNTSGTKSGLTAPTISSKDLFTESNKNAKVQLVEYGDFQCPSCASYQPLVDQLEKDEGDKIYHAFRMFPLTNVHQNAHISAQAAYAANKQGKFWEMSDELFTNQTDWAQSVDPRSIFLKYAQDLGMNTAQFSNDMNSNEASKFVDDQLNQALALGLNSTPSFFINGKYVNPLPANYTDFKKLVDDELNKK